MKNCSLLTFYLLIALRACCSRALSSAITPSCNVLRNSLGSTAKLRPTFLKVAFSASISMLMAPSGSAMAWGSKEKTIFAALMVLGATLVDVALLCPTLAYSWVVWICILCRPIWMATKECFYYYSNYYSSFGVASLTLSPMSSNSPSVKVIGLSDDLVALVFFRDPSFSYSQFHFT